MKKLFFLLLFPLWGIGGFPAFAQSHINIELLSATYTAPAVQFRVSWNSIPAVDGETHNSKIWLWVDFRKIENNQPSGSWTRATVANPSSGTLETGNDKGFWLQGNSGSYSQIVTVALTNITANTKFNWCAYGSDAPPKVTAANGTYTLYGTPPFILTAAGGTATQTVAATSIATSAVTITPVTLTDETGCPGVFCIYTGNDLYIDATHLCQTRATGEQNWEAWIKDTRDNELYRIVLMPDKKWWLAQNVRYAGTGSSITISGCTPEICGRYYTQTEVNGEYQGTYGYGANVQGVCPKGWVIPLLSEWKEMFDSISTNVTTLLAMVRPINSPCDPITDNYGWANQIMVGYDRNTTGDHWWSNDGSISYVRTDHKIYIGTQCNNMEYVNKSSVNPNLLMAVRCFRQL